MGLLHIDGVVILGVKDNPTAKAAINHMVLAGQHGPQLLLFMRRIARKRTGEWAKLLNVRQETVSKWEHGHRPIGPHSFACMCSVIGIDTDITLVLSVFSRPVAIERIEV